MNGTAVDLSTVWRILFRETCPFEPALFKSATSLRMTTQVPCTLVTLAAGPQFAKIAKWI